MPDLGLLGGGAPFGFAGRWLTLRRAPPLRLLASSVGAALPAAPLVAGAPSAQLSDAAALMLRSALHTLPVVEAAPPASDANAAPPPPPPRLLGVVSRVDLLRAALAAADAADAA